MKRVGLLALGLMFTAVFAASASAQPGAVPAAVAAGKVVWLDSGAFADDKEGISKYVQAQKALETEMAPKTAELKTLQTQMQTLQDDIEKLQKTPAGVPAANVQRQIQEKTDQGQGLQRQFEFKQKDAQAYYSKRAAEVLSPISQQIMKSLSDYAKAKGFTVILDIAVMAGDGQSPGSLLYLDPSADITKDFISYFNKGAGAATATTTKPQ